jgi:hypothetical protein
MKYNHVVVNYGWAFKASQDAKRSSGVTRLEEKLIARIAKAKKGELLRLRSGFVADLVNGKDPEMSRRLVNAINQRLSILK